MKRVMLLLVIAGLVSLSAIASPLCTTATLQTYITSFTNQANACQIGDKLFWGFSLTDLAGATADPTASQITLTPLGADPANPGIRFGSGGWVIAFNDVVHQSIAYSVATISGSVVIKDATLGATGSVANGGTGLITETITPAGPSSPLSVNLASANLSQNVDFSANKLAMLQVVDEILVTAPLESSSVHLSIIDNNFSEVIPEPWTVLPLGAGLTLLGLMGRRNRAIAGGGK